MRNYYILMFRPNEDKPIDETGIGPYTEWHAQQVCQKLQQTAKITGSKLRYVLFESNKDEGF